MADNLGSVLFNALSTGVGSYNSARQENADKKDQNKLKLLDLAFKMSQDQRAQQGEMRAQQEQQNQNELFQLQKQVQNNALATSAAQLKELTRRMSMTPQQRDAEDAAHGAAVEAAKYAEQIKYLTALRDAGITTTANAPHTAGRGDAKSIAQQRLLLNDRLKMQMGDVLASAPGGGFSSPGALFTQNAANLNDTGILGLGTPDSSLVPTVESLKSIGSRENVMATLDTLGQMFPGVFNAPVDSLMAPQTTTKIPTKISIGGQEYDAPKSRAEIEKIKKTKPNLYGILIHWADSVGLK